MLVNQVTTGLSHNSAAEPEQHLQLTSRWRITIGLVIATNLLRSRSRRLERAKYCAW